MGSLVLDDLDCANRVDSDFLHKRVVITVNSIGAECRLFLTHFLTFTKHNNKSFKTDSFQVAKTPVLPHLGFKKMLNLGIY